MEMNALWCFKLYYFSELLERYFDTSNTTGTAGTAFFDVEEMGVFA